MIKKVYEMDNYHKIRSTDKKLSGDKLMAVFKNNDVKYLDDNFTGWVSIVPDLKGYLMYVDHWTIEYPTSGTKALIFHYTKYYANNLTLFNSISKYTMLTDNLRVLEITKYIEKYPNIIISDNDPWGEEDWDEYITEMFDIDGDDALKIPILKKEKTLKFKDFLRFDLLSLRKLEILRDYLDNEIIIIRQGKNTIKGRVVRIKPIKIAKGEEYYEFTLVTKDGNRAVTVTKNDEFKVKIPKKSKIDPYNEEDWDLYV